MIPYTLPVESYMPHINIPGKEARKAELERWAAAEAEAEESESEEEEKEEAVSSPLAGSAATPASTLAEFRRFSK